MRTMFFILVFIFTVFSQENDFNEAIDISSTSLQKEILTENTDAASVSLSKEYLNENTDNKLDLSKFIVNTNFLNKHAFQFKNGEKLSLKKTHEIVSVVPENEKLLKQGKAWRIAGWVLLGTALGLNAVYLESNNDNVIIATGSASAFTYCFAFMSAGIFGRKNLQSVDNYNYYIAGGK